MQRNTDRCKTVDSGFLQPMKVTAKQSFVQPWKTFNILFAFEFFSYFHFVNSQEGGKVFQRVQEEKAFWTASFSDQLVLYVQMRIRGKGLTIRFTSPYRFIFPGMLLFKFLEAAITVRLHAVLRMFLHNKDLSVSLQCNFSFTVELNIM